MSNFTTIHLKKDAMYMNAETGSIDTGENWACDFFAWKKETGLCDWDAWCSAGLTEVESYIDDLGEQSWKEVE